MRTPHPVTLNVMPMRIEGSEDIRDIFSFFHDGSITHAKRVGSDLILEVEIQYLAKRINSSFEKFYIRLVNVRDIRFTTWPRDSQSPPLEIADTSLIFKPELEILEVHNEEGAIQVICLQSSPGFNYVGGELYLQADFAQVTDEAGSHYSMDELRSLCKGYWHDFSNKNQA